MCHECNVQFTKCIVVLTCQLSDRSGFICRGQGGGPVSGDTSVAL